MFKSKKLPFFWNLRFLLITVDTNIFFRIFNRSGVMNFQKSTKIYDSVNCILFVFIHIRHLYFTYASVYWLPFISFQVRPKSTMTSLLLFEWWGYDDHRSKKGVSLRKSMVTFANPWIEQCPASSYARSYTFLYTTFCTCCAAPTFSLLTMALIN